MNFDELYEKYQRGEATEEEKNYVEGEIAKARKLAAIIDAADAKRVIEPAERETVKKAKKAFTVRATVRTVLIAVILLLLAAVAVTGSVFGVATHYAKTNAVVTREQAVELAKKYVAEYDTGITHLTLSEVDRELIWDGGLKKAYYEYEIELERSGNGRLVEYELLVDARTGAVTLTDVDG